jgi:hypothetical protein
MTYRIGCLGSTSFSARLVKPAVSLYTRTRQTGHANLTVKALFTEFLDIKLRSTNNSGLGTLRPGDKQD